MPPLMRCDVDGPAELVADVAALEPGREPVAEGVGAVGQPPLEVAFLADQQAGGGGKTFPHGLLLDGDRAGERHVNRHERVAAHLMVAVAQIGCAVLVTRHAVNSEPAAVTDAQAGAHQHLGQQPGLRISETCQHGR